MVINPPKASSNKTHSKQGHLNEFNHYTIKEFDAGPSGILYTLPQARIGKIS